LVDGRLVNLPLRLAILAGSDDPDSSMVFGNRRNSYFENGRYDALSSFAISVFLQDPSAGSEFHVASLGVLVYWTRQFGFDRKDHSIPVCGCLLGKYCSANLKLAILF
jgi:hypothetical protein